MLRIVFLLAFAIFLPSSFGEPHSHENYVTYGDLRTDLNGLRNQIESLRSAIETLKNKARGGNDNIPGRLTTLEGTVNVIKGNLQGTESNLNSKIYQQQRKLQELKTKLGSASGSTCYTRHTSWNDGAYKSTMHLDRHDVRCMDDEFLRGIKLERGGHNIRYKYTCCEISV